MCIVIDTNTIPSVFDTSSQNHGEFEPVLDWILHGNGKMVYGGTKYLQEVIAGPHLKRYRSIIQELQRVRKVVLLDKDTVDQDQVRVSQLISDPKFDDEHLAAIFRISKCRVLCSGDNRSFDYLRDNRLFKSRDRPRIYKSSRNRCLLVEENICDCCKPKHRLSKPLQDQLNAALTAIHC